MSRRQTSSQLPFAIGLPALIWQVLFFYLPLAIIVLSSVIALSDRGYFTGFTFEKIGFFCNALYFRVIVSSLALGLSNALICFLIAFPLAYLIAFSSSVKKNLLLFLLIVPFWTNFLLHVYAWFFVLEKQGFLNQLLQWIHLVDHPTSLLNTPIAIMIMMVYYYLPFMVIPLYSSLERMDRRLIEASYDLGASWTQTLSRVILPLTKKGVKAGFFLVYIPSFGEFAIPELMGGDRYMFVGSVVANYILGDETGSLGAAFTVLASICLIASAIALYYLIDKLIPGE